MIATDIPFRQYLDKSGLALDGGYLYFGMPNQNPETSPITVYWDAAGTLPAAQPIRTINGFAVRNGNIANVFSSAEYSITIRNAKRELVSYSPTSSAFDAAVALSASTGAGLIGWIQSGIGAVARWLLDKLRESVSVADYGAVGDGVTDDSASIQKALTAMSVRGGGTVLTTDSHYIASSITVPPNVFFKGPLGNIGGQGHASENFNLVRGTLYVNSAATINVSNASAVRGFQVINSALRSALPFANAAAAQAAVNAFSGTAFTCIGSDPCLEHLIILGFNQAIKSDNGTNMYRQKFNWIDIDCTNGIDVEISADVPRIANVHCWDFLTFNVGLGDYSLRSGTAFKVGGNFDEGHFTNCFAYGYAVGFDINALIDVTLLDCGVDSWAANPVNPGQIGVKVRGTVDQVKIIGGAYSAVDKAVEMSSTGSLTITGGATFFGNKTHVYASAGKLRITGNAFNYMNSTWGGTTAIQLTSGVTSPPNITNNHFDFVPFAYVLNTGAGSNAESATIWGNSFSGGSTDPFVGERMVTENGGVATKTFTYYAGNATAQILKMRKSRGTIAAPVIVNNGDSVGQMSGEVWKGDAWSPIAGVRYQVDGAPSGTSTPGIVLFSTTPSGATALVDQVAINNLGHLYPLSNKLQSCGFAGFNWKNVYSENITLQPPASVTPSSNGDMTFELTSNTQLKIKVKGSDGTVRSTSLVLA